MRADSRKLVHAGLTKPSLSSIADQRALQFRKLWRSIVRRDIVVWVDKWWNAQFWANPVKPNVCLDVTAIAVAMVVVQQHGEMLKVCTDMCNAPVSRRTTRAPLDIAREGGRQHLFWKPFGIYESGKGQNQDVLDLLDMLRSTQQHCQNPIGIAR